MDIIRDYIAKIDWRHPHISHAGTFVLGAFLTFGVVAVDGRLNSSTYTTTNTASVAKVTEIEEVVEEEMATTSEEVVSEEEEVVDEEEEIVEEEVVELAIENVPDESAPASQTSDSGNSGGSQEAAQEAMEEAERVLEQITVSTDEPEEDEPQYFTTPTGLTIDQYGNIVDPNTGSVTETAQDNSNSNSSNVTLPEGVYQLPNGQLVYADGSIYKENTDPQTTYVQQNPVDDYYTSPSGAVFDRQGNLISLPPEEEEELIPPTIVSTSSPPTEGSTINIPLYVKTRSDLNSFVTCEGLKFTGNDLALCELFREHRFDYDWVAVETEE